jgi:hypothetical protein
MAMTITRSQLGSIERIQADWTSAVGGGQTQTIDVSGIICRVTTNPGSTAPTDNYDLTLVDEDGLDLFAGQGADRDTTNSESFCPGVPLKDGTTTSVVPVAHVGVATAGDAKVGKVLIFVKR